ncbi:hypothetical protein HU200_060892 [Digitaria exilis]|uniref:Uncharacterized protein n=1 Tax=Digitaria exilis TaxID=1010633 RepID=A0A835ADP2_9POAL|nr:hypothetical protein HU200_060892 [Digitaria exilis]
MATLTSSSSSSSSSPRCVPFGFHRGGDRRCRAAEVVGGGIRGAFFASLDRCNCVELRTKHDDSFRMLDAAAPLMRDAPPSADAGGRTSSTPSGTKQRRRRGLGCCTAHSNVQARSTSSAYEPMGACCVLTGRACKPATTGAVPSAIAQYRLMGHHIALPATICFGRSGTRLRV